MFCEIRLSVITLEHYARSVRWNVKLWRATFRFIIQ